MGELEEFIDYVELIGRARDQGPRRYLRDYSDPFRKYSTREFFSRYRFTPETVKDKLMPILEPHLRKPTRRGLPFATEVMILVTLRYFATGSFQQLGGDVVNICQQSISRIIHSVSTVLASQMKNIVKFPPLPELNRVKLCFCELAGFPGVIGCLDCTHIKIKNPGGPTAEVYRNRKGWFSLNVQAVAGPNLMFYDMVVRWPGSSHDSFIYNSSSLKQRLISNELPGIVLGDSGYAVSSVLMTPYLTPGNPSQERYNRSHIKTRNTVERAFGVWKRRFPCLQVGMAVKLETAVAVICSCAALHNLAIFHNDEIDLPLQEEEEDDAFTYDESVSESQDGFLAREALVMRFFSQ